MNTFRLVLILTKFLAVYGGLTHLQDFVPRIIGGHDAQPNSRPYMISLQARILMLRAHFCGGSLLNKNWVITAAHCVNESWLVRWLPVDAVAGAHNVDSIGAKAQIKTIAKRVVHPNYKGNIGPNDIALLRTDSPFTFTKEIQPIRLPTMRMDLSNSSSLLLNGWGALRTTAFFPDTPTFLQEVDVTYIPHSKCYEAVDKIKDADEENPLDEQANICSGPITGGISACSGDSGGPLAVYLSDIKRSEKEDKDKTETDKNKIKKTDEESKFFFGSYDDDEDDYLEYYEYLDYYDYELRSNGDGGKGRKCKCKSQTKKTRSSNDTPILLGIVSWGMSPCGEEGAPTVYTKVSNYLDFIQRNIPY